MSKKNVFFNVLLKLYKSNVCEDKLDIYCMIKNLGVLKYYFEIIVVFYFFQRIDFCYFFGGGGFWVNGIFVIYLLGIEVNFFIEYVCFLGNY